MEEYARMSWCATDVCELHNHDPLICGEGGCPIYNDSIPVIYPDNDPRGEGLAPPEPPLVPEPVEDVIYPGDTPQGRLDGPAAIQSSWDDAETLFPDDNPQGTTDENLNVRLRRVPQKRRTDSNTGIPKVLYSPDDVRGSNVPDRSTQPRR